MCTLQKYILWTIILTKDSLGVTLLWSPLHPHCIILLMLCRYTFLSNQGSSGCVELISQLSCLVYVSQSLPVVLQRGVNPIQHNSNRSRMNSIQNQQRITPVSACAMCVASLMQSFTHYIYGTKQQPKQETHFCHSILDLAQDKATARYGYHSLAVILTRTRTMVSLIQCIVRRGLSLYR